MLPKRLHVGDQVLGRVESHFRGRVARVRCGFPASALIEKDDAVSARVKRTPHVRRNPLPWTAMEHDGRLAVARATDLPSDRIARADTEHAPLVWLERWVK